MAEAQVVEEQEEEECPKCPPAGAPAWMATFADMATLLMAFFVLILSFAEFNVPKFKQISGSLKNAFGVQKVVPVVEQPKGTTVLSLNFSPSPAPSVTKNLRQQTSDSEQKNLDLKSEIDEGDSAKSNSKEVMDAKELSEQIKSEVSSEDVKVETVNDKVLVSLNTENKTADEISNLIKDTVDAVENARESTGANETDVLIGGIDKDIKSMASAEIENKSLKEQMNNLEKQNSNDKKDLQEKTKKAEFSEDQLKVALKQEIGKGLAEVQREKDRVIVTVGSAGAFSSGSARLTKQARAIMQKIAKVSGKGAGQVNVSGHTDNVPLIFGGQYRDNWDLAAARASSVVQELAKANTIPSEKLKAISFGETKPIEQNDTRDGREKNRRIEIEIKY
ncbi:OmpA family protein [Alphaproteobacteria bacterium]|jgi:chemotaxis protein MotB|nr:OmpA family protein [Alphaproteobacteria bacterium]MDB2584455.1 OmpA family protein [Alphaproteobacteria bacterium]MDC0968906.1 flagellar motor protein MotB [Alphaproteobacteria bacterium]